MTVSQPDEGAVVGVRLLRQVLARVGAALYVVDVDGTISAANAKAEDLLGYRYDEVLGHSAHDLLHRADATGAARHPLRCPLAEAARAGVPAADDNDVFVRKDGSLMPAAWDSEPIVAGGTVTGSVVVFEDLTLPVEGGRAQLELAYQERDASRAELARGAFLADVTSALASTLDGEEALRRLARLLVPRFADWCVMDLIDGDTVSRVTIAHRQPDEVAALGPDSALVFPLSEVTDPLLARVLQGGPGGPVDRFPDPSAAGSEVERRRLELFERLGATSALTVGLRARQTTLGALTLVRTDLDWPFRSDDLVMATDIAHRAAMSMDNARLYREQRSTAEALQRSLLPELPHVEHLSLCAAYVPSAQGADIGGDWYDSFVLPRGVTTMVLGDVAGHDLAAAVQMSSIRNLLRATALRAEDPAEVMSLLDGAMAQFTPEVTATAIFARIEGPPGQRLMRWSNAGHPPPLLVSPDGSTRFLDTEADLLLGADPGFARHTSTEELPPGSTVLLYSDGLVEDRTTGVEPGMARLRRAAANLAVTEPGAFCDQLVEDLGRQRDDDVAVVALLIPAPADGAPAPG